MSRVDPKETSNEKRTPMRIAAENNNDEIVEILSEAIGEGIPDEVKLLQLSRVMSGPQSDNERKSEVSVDNIFKIAELLDSLSPELVIYKMTYPLVKDISSR